MPTRRTLFACGVVSLFLLSCEGREFLFDDSLDGQPGCLISTSELRFSRFVGFSQEKEFTIRNTGSGPMQGRIFLPEDATGRHVSDFEVVAGGGVYRLDPGSIRRVRVRFEPSTAESTAVSLNLTGACRALPLLGVGLEPPECLASPDSLNFGTVALGLNPPTSMDFLLENNGTTTVSGTVATSCPNFVVATNPSFSLGPGASQTVPIEFIPDAPQDYECRVTFGTPFCNEVVLLGRGTGTPNCTVSTNQLAFGDVVADGANGAVGTRSFVVRNSGGGSLALDLAISQPSTAPFSIQGSSTFTLAAGDSATVSVRFDPDKTPAEYVEFSAVVSGMGDCTVGLTGRGLVTFNEHMFDPIVTNCGSCHPGSGNPNIRIYSVATTPGYLDFDDPPNSVFVRNPLGFGHPTVSAWASGTVPNLTAIAWIEQGAVEGP